MNRILTILLFDLRRLGWRNWLPFCGVVILVVALFVAVVVYQRILKLDPQLAVAFARGTTDATGMVDLMPNLPSWLPRSGSADAAGEALHEKSGFVCANVQDPDGAPGLNCRLFYRSVCRHDYRLLASFPAGHLTSLTGQHIMICT